MEITRHYWVLLLFTMNCYLKNPNNVILLKVHIEFIFPRIPFALGLYMVFPSLNFPACSLYIETDKKTNLKLAVREDFVDMPLM